jgi:hypothetical protein
MSIRHLSLIVAAALIGNSAMAQKKEIYTIQVGSFEGTNAADFKKIEGLGFLYTEAADAARINVYIGDYATADAAKAMQKQIKAKGFPAYLSPRKLDAAKINHVVQLDMKKTSDKIDWTTYEKAGKIYVTADEAQIKIFSGGFKDEATATAAVQTLKDLGFKTAFHKSVAVGELHKVSTFTTGNLALNGAIVPTKKGPIAPATPTNSGKKDDFIVKGGTAVKRNALGKLQEVLKEAEYYDGKIDGDNAKATTTAYNEAVKENRILQKYQAVINNAAPISVDKVSELQKAINELPDDLEANTAILKKSNQPIAKAYRAYSSFIQQGESKEVDNLMNEAIKTSFASTQNKFPFDERATYAYKELGQLILHLRYIQGAAKEEPATPAWLLATHTKECATAFNSNFNVQINDGFMDWNELALVSVIAKDLSSKATKVDTKKDNEEAVLRTRLFLLPKAPDASTKKNVTTWASALWKGMDTWAAKDEFNEQTAEAFKIAFFKGQVRLEDYFMSKNFKADEATTLALQVLESASGRALERFMPKKIDILE